AASARPGSSSATATESALPSPTPDAELAAQGRARGVVAAHAVYAAAWWCGRRAEINALHRGSVVVPAHGRTEHGLSDRGGTDVDVAADVVRMRDLLISRSQHRPAKDEIAESGGEPLDLTLDALGHVDGGTGRHMAVGPQSLPA